jgi:hypothetical protein
MLEYSTLTGILSGHRYLPVIRQRVVTGYNLAPSIGDSMSAVVLALTVAAPTCSGIGHEHAVLVPYVARITRYIIATP